MKGEGYMSNLIVAANRQESGRKTRKQGYIPGVIYGPGVEHNLDVQFDRKIIHRFLKNHSTGSKAKVKANDRELLCVIKDIQYGLVNKDPIHIDFYASSGDSSVKVTVPLKFTGKEKLAAGNLVLNILQDGMEIQGALKDLPEVVEIDVSGMTDGSEITMGDIILPEGVKLLSREDVVVANVIEAKAGVSSESEADSESTAEV